MYEEDPSDGCAVMHAPLGISTHAYIHTDALPYPLATPLHVQASTSCCQVFGKTRNSDANKIRYFLQTTKNIAIQESMGIDKGLL